MGGGEGVGLALGEGLAEADGSDGEEDPEPEGSNTRVKTSAAAMTAPPSAATISRVLGFEKLLLIAPMMIWNVRPTFRLTDHLEI